MDDHNPYAAPQADGLTPADDRAISEHESVRRGHIGRETWIKSIGMLCFLGAIMVVMTASGIAATRGSGNAPALAHPHLLLGWMMVSAILAVMAGISLIRLRSAGRIIYTVRIGVDLLISLVLSAGTAYASGQVIGPYIIPLIFMILLWTGRAGVVFSDHYRNVVIPATPHVKFRTSRSTWMVLACIVVVVAVLVLIGPARR